MANRYVSGGCVTCVCLRANAWARANLEKNRARANAWRKANLGRSKARANAWAIANPEKHNAHGRTWKKENRGKCNASHAARHAAKLQRTPSWADLDAIRVFYEGCPVGHHVDHEIPLQGELISGLHVLENLQYLPAVENIAKGNRIDLAAPELL